MSFASSPTHAGVCLLCQQRLPSGRAHAPVFAFATQPAPAKLPLDVHRIGEVFNRLSDNGAGVLNRSHLLCAMHLCGVDTSAGHAQGVINAHMNGHAANGTLDHGEFAALVKRILEGPSVNEPTAGTGGGGAKTQPTARIALEEAKAATKSASAALAAAMGEADAARKRRAWQRAAEVEEYAAAAAKAEEWAALQRALQDERDALRQAQEQADLASGVRGEQQQHAYVDPNKDVWASRWDDASAAAARRRRDPAGRAMDRRNELRRAAAEREAAKRQDKALEAERQNAQRWAAFNNAVVSAQQDRPAVVTPQRHYVARTPVHSEEEAATPVTPPTMTKQEKPSVEELEAIVGVDQAAAIPGAAGSPALLAHDHPTVLAAAAAVTHDRLLAADDIAPELVDAEVQQLQQATAVAEEVPAEVPVETSEETPELAAAAAEKAELAGVVADEVAELAANDATAAVMIADAETNPVAEGIDEEAAGADGVNAVEGELPIGAASPADAEAPASSMSPDGTTLASGHAGEEKVESEAVERAELNEASGGSLKNVGGMKVTTRFVFFPNTAEADTKAIGKAWPALEGAWDAKGARSYDWVG